MSGHRSLTVVQSAEVIRARVSGATLTGSRFLIDILDGGEISIEIAGVGYEKGIISLVDGLTADGEHITIHLHPTGEVTALLDE